MADISLRDYLAKLDILLNKGASDEVIHHCRHILQYFPKNAAAYRYLGLALLNAGNWDKAGEVFRRVLSVYPDDFTAHVGLSEVCSNLKRPDEAIWHLERAYEQEPNNQEIIKNLREMYHKYRKVEQTKLQLTAGAVARQYIRNGLYEQAVDSLKQSLERSPERVDLRLLLARTYSDAGRQVEAGETALEVLKVLPDCLEANQILTEIWLEVQRPSDAQRYLNRIQSLEPYRAMELAQGQPVPDEQFRLEELDYRSSAQKEIVSRAPDWLQDIEPTAADSGQDAELEDWMSGVSVTAPAAAEESQPDFEDDLFSTELPDDWLTASQPDEAPPAGGQPRSGLTGLLSALEVPEESTPADEPAPEPTLETSTELFPSFETDALTEAETPSETVDELPDLFPEANQAVVPSTSPVSEADPLAWMHESGIELVEAPETPTFDDEDELSVQAMDEVNPLAWLEGYGDHLISDEAKTPVSSEVEEELPASEDEAALDWMQQNASPDSVEAPPVQEKLDPLDWLADESLLEEALNLEALTDEPGVKASPEAVGWAQDTTQQSDRQDVMAEENPFAWLDSQDDDQPPQDDQQSVPDQEVWLPESGVPQPVSGKPDAEGESGFEWMTGDEQPSAETPEWAALGTTIDEAASEPETSASEFEWMPSDETEAEEPPVTAGDMPGWLAQLESQEAGAESPAEEAAMPEWLTEVQLPQSESEPAAEEAAVPDWLAEMQPEAEAEPEAAEPAAGDEMEWLSEAVVPGAEPAAEEAAVPDWLAEMQLRQPETQESPVEEAGLVSEDVEEETPVEFAEAAPDWLAEMQAQQPKAAEPETMDEPAWISDLNAEAEVVSDEAVSEAPEAANEPAWLTDLEVEEDTVPGQAVEESPWMPEEETELESVEADEAVPEWLSQLQPQAEAEAPEEEEPFGWMDDESEQQPASVMSAASETHVSDEFDWGDEEEGAAESGSSENVPDWLNELQAPAEPEAAVSEPASGEFSWIDDINAPDVTEEEEEALLSEFPDFESEPEIRDADYTPEEEVVPSPASNAPDWLNAMVPGLDVDYAAPEDEPIEQTYAEQAAEPDMTEMTPEVSAEPESRRGFEWLVELVDEETREVPVVQHEGGRGRFAFSRLPAWLRRSAEAHDDTPGDPGQAVDAESDADLPPWLK